LRDRRLGVIFFVLSIVAMVGYFWLLFLSPPDATFLEKPLSEWAIIIPVGIIVYAVLIVVAWIGWALASTAPPLPVTGEASENQKEEN
jgi:Na+/H+ antiporter NhaC